MMNRTIISLAGTF